MFKRLLSKMDFSKISHSPVVTGLEVFIFPDGTRRMNLTILKRSGSKIAQEKTAAINEIEQIKEIVGVFPIMLCMDGKGFLHKKVSCLEDDNQQTLLQKVFPNASEDDFYVQVNKVGIDKAFVSLIRRDILNSILTEFKTANLEIIDCCFGPFCLENILTLTGTKYSQISTVERTVYLSANQIDDFDNSIVETVSSTLKIGEEQIPSSQLISFSSAFGYFISEKEPFIPALKSNKEELKERIIFRFVAKVAMISFLVILLGNYLVSDHYWKKMNQLSSLYVVNSSALVKLDSLKKELAEKESFFQAGGFLENSRTSFYADRIGASLPIALKLYQLNIHPVINKQGEDDKTIFANRNIEIKGMCKKSTEVNEWMKLIRNKNWVKQVNLLNYTQDKSNETAEFDIELKLN